MDSKCNTNQDDLTFIQPLFVYINTFLYLIFRQFDKPIQSSQKLIEIIWREKTANNSRKSALPHPNSTRQVPLPNNSKSL